MDAGAGSRDQVEWTRTFADKEKTVDWLRFPKAGKQHQCDWCKTAIEKGEKHAYRFVTNDPGSWRMHRECDKAMRSTIDPYSPEICDGWHDRGKNCDETPCQNSQNAPIEAIKAKAQTNQQDQQEAQETEQDQN